MATKGAWPRSHDPLYISGMAEATHFKFGVQKGYKEYYQNAKLRDTGGVYLWNG